MLGTSKQSFYNAVGDMKSFFIVSKLGFNTGFTAANMIQPVFTLPWHANLTSHGIPHNPFKTFVMGGVDAIAGYAKYALGLAIPKSQRGGIDIKAIGDSVKEAVKKITGKDVAVKDTTVATKESVLASIPGRKEAMKDYIPADPTAAEILTESLGAGDSKLKMTGVQSGATMTGIKYNSPLIQGIGRLYQNAQKRSEKLMRNLS